MNGAVGLVLGSTCLLSVYAVLDHLLRQDGLLRWPATLRLALAFVSIGLGPIWPWPELLPFGPDLELDLDGLCCLSAFVLNFLTWNAVTRDHDIVAGGPSGKERLLTALAAALSWFSPGAFLVTVSLLSTRFRFWQHHAAFPMRLLLLSAAGLVSWYLARGVAFLTGWRAAEQLAADLPSSILLLLTVLFVSHYFITALAKMFLGPKPWSWMARNRLHYLATSAYSWGWANFLSWSSFRRVVSALERVERPLQVLVFALECTVVFSFSDAKVAATFCALFAFFHVGVFLLSGLLFWDWILTDLAVGGLFAFIDTDLSFLAFGIEAQLVGMALLAWFPLRHKLWRPIPLGWYDTPFTQRVRYVVRGRSGRTYGLYNDFMCPHERLYGKVAGCFAFAGRVLTYHLGEAFRLDLRDAIVAAGPDSARLEEVKQRFGIEPWSQELTLRHMAYLKEFFRKLNGGAEKSALPRALRFLKAPGDQLFYWGPLPPFHGQEEVTSVELYYVEEFFDGASLRRLTEELLLSIPIREHATAPAVAWTPEEVICELTPGQLDEHLIRASEGRLIDASGFRQRYLEGDDGKPTDRLVSESRQAPAE